MICVSGSCASPRPGKAPASIIRSQFAGDIRQRVLENLIPKALQKQVEAEDLHPVGTPDISDVHFHDGEPLKFKATFEVVPEIVPAASSEKSMAEVVAPADTATGVPDAMRQSEAGNWLGQDTPL